MFLPVLLLLAQDTGLETTLKEFRDKVRGDVPCMRTADENEIVVCARRDADRYRVPLITTSAGREASGERLRRLLSPDAAGYVPCGKGAFMAKCGSVGVGATIDSGGNTRVSTALRPLAP
jgi:hypothetical protein